MLPVCEPLPPPFMAEAAYVSGHPLTPPFKAEMRAGIYVWQDVRGLMRTVGCARTIARVGAETSSSSAFQGGDARRPPRPLDGLL